MEKDAHNSIPTMSLNGMEEYLEHKQLKDLKIHGLTDSETQIEIHQQLSRR